MLRFRRRSNRPGRSRGSRGPQLALELPHRHAARQRNPARCGFDRGHARQPPRGDAPQRRPASVTREGLGQARQRVERPVQRREIAHEAPAAVQALSRVVVQARVAELRPQPALNEAARDAGQRHADPVQRLLQRDRVLLVGLPGRPAWRPGRIARNRRRRGRAAQSTRFPPPAGAAGSIERARAANVVLEGPRHGDTRACGCSRPRRTATGHDTPVAEAGGSKTHGQAGERGTVIRGPTSDAHETQRQSTACATISKHSQWSLCACRCNCTAERRSRGGRRLNIATRQRQRPAEHALAALDVRWLAPASAPTAR